MTCNFKFCDTFKISKLICVFNGRRNPDSGDLEFNLIRQDGEHYSFDNVIPESDNYLFAKIDKNEKIISLEGGYIKKLGVNKKKMLGKYLYEIRKNNQLFLDFIKPLYEYSIKKGEAYQFTFNTNRDEVPLICSLYPCCIPGCTSSVDVVIRRREVVFRKESLSDFVINSANNGCPVPSLN